NTMTGTVLDVAGVHEKFGVGPELIIDYLALRGDKGDNSPGGPGGAEKTARRRLTGLGGNLAVPYASRDKVAEVRVRGAKKLPEKLLEHRDMAYLSRQLATIKVDCELDVKVGELMPGTPDRDALIELYRSLEFKAWLDELLREAKAAGASVETVDQTP